MTLPEKIYLHERHDEFDVQLYGEYTRPYIRADIAEELAKALEKCPGSIGRQALARYRATMEKG